MSAMIDWCWRYFGACTNTSSTKATNCFHTHTVEAIALADDTFTMDDYDT